MRSHGLTRMGWFFALAVSGGSLTYWLAPAQIPLLIWKMTIIALAAFVGYWIDRHIFPYARPHMLVKSYDGHLAMIRRAFIVGATIVAFALAL